MNKNARITYNIYTFSINVFSFLYCNRVRKTGDGKGDYKTKFHTLHDIICNVFFVLIKSLKTKKKSGYNGWLYSRINNLFELAIWDSDNMLKTINSL
jgi:hypothetical protein